MDGLRCKLDIGQRIEITKARRYEKSEILGSVSRQSKHSYVWTFNDPYQLKRPLFKTRGKTTTLASAVHAIYAVYLRITTPANTAYITHVPIKAPIEHQAMPRMSSVFSYQQTILDSIADMVGAMYDPAILDSVDSLDPRTIRNVLNEARNGSLALLK